MLNAAWSDEVDRADHVRYRAAIDVHAESAGRQHAGQRLATRATHRLQREAPEVQEIVQGVELDPGFDVNELQRLPESVQASVEHIGQDAVQLVRLDDVIRGHGHV